MGRADDIEHKGTPQCPDPKRLGTEVPIRVSLEGPEDAVPDDVAPARDESRPRRMKLTAKIFTKHGYTEGCEGCARARTGVMEGRPHSEECRRRIEACMSEDAEGRETMRRDKERIDRKRERSSRPCEYLR